MPTGQVIITSALTALGINEQGGIPSVSDSADALLELNAMWNAWGIDEGLIFAVQQLQFALAANVGTYPVGPSAAAPFNVALPSRIYKAVFVTAGGRTEIDVVPQQQYFSHNDLAASAVSPDELYPDFNPSPTTGSASFNLWPVPSVSGAKLEIEAGAAFSSWALGTNYILPQGFQDAIQYCLAFRLLPRFGVAVAQQVAAVVTSLAQKAEARIREMNAFNRKLPPAAVAAPGTQEAPAAPVKG